MNIRNLVVRKTTSNMKKSYMILFHILKPIDYKIGTIFYLLHYKVEIIILLFLMNFSQTIISNYFLSVFFFNVLIYIYLDWLIRYANKWTHTNHWNFQNRTFGLGKIKKFAEWLTFLKCIWSPLSTTLIDFLNKN